MARLIALESLACERLLHPEPFTEVMTPNAVTRRLLLLRRYPVRPKNIGGSLAYVSRAIFVSGSLPRRQA